MIPTQKKRRFPRKFWVASIPMDSKPIGSRSENRAIGFQNFSDKFILVGGDWNMAVITSPIVGMMIQSDFHIFHGVTVGIPRISISLYI